jgi:hypothetical protein
MAFFTDPCSKLERAVRQLLILQGKAKDYPDTDCYIGHYSQERALPSRSVIVPGFNVERSYRPEGICHLQIEHAFQAALQPNQSPSEQRVGMDTWIGQTLDTLNLAGPDTDQNLSLLADAITAAGRWLAEPGTNPSPEDLKIVADNADMANFRCDWVKFNAPFIEKGHSPLTPTVWIVVVNLAAFVSHSSQNLPN